VRYPWIFGLGFKRFLAYRNDECYCKEEEDRSEGETISLLRKEVLRGEYMVCRLPENNKLVLIRMAGRCGIGGGVSFLILWTEMPMLLFFIPVL
jgi:hypothetical protein